MKKLLFLVVIFLASCMVPSRIVERYETDSTGKVTKYVTKYYDSVRYVREPCPWPIINPYPFYDPIWGPRVIVRSPVIVRPRVVQQAPIRRQHR